MAFHVRTYAAGLACCLTLAGADMVYGQAPVRTRETTTTSTTTIHRVSAVMGDNVVVSDGGTVGKVEDIVLSENGCVDYVVVSYENKYVLVPWGVTTWNVQDRTLRVNITKDRFTQVPTFTRDHWPSLTDSQYIGRVRTAFGVTESGFRGDRREGDRRPLGSAENRQDNRTDRRDDRRDANRPPADRRDTENRPNTNRPNTDRPPADRPPADRPPADRPADRRDNTRREPPPPPPPNSNPPSNRPNPPPPPPPA